MCSLFDFAVPDFARVIALRSQARLFLFAFPLLYGCAYTPSDVISGGSVVTGTSILAPKLLAECLIKNHEQLSGEYFSQMKATQDFSAIEVTLRNSARVVGVARIHATSHGSAYTLYYMKYAFASVLRDKTIKGCMK